jgi:hypothetical protein
MAAKKKRAGKTVTLSISVDEDTQRFLRQEAKRSFDGNVSALIAALVREASRIAAAKRLLRGQDVDPHEYAAFLGEMRGKTAPPKKHKRRHAA